MMSPLRGFESTLKNFNINALNYFYVPQKRQNYLLKAQCSCRIVFICGTDLHAISEEFTKKSGCIHTKISPVQQTFVCSLYGYCF